MVYTKGDKDGIPVVSGVVTSAKDIPQFDLSRLNMVQVVQELSEIMNKPNPKSRLAKWWQNKHIPHDRERIDFLESYLASVRRINQETVNLQSELFLSQAVIENTILGYTQQAKFKMELQLKEHEYNLNHLKKMMEVEDLTTERMKAEIDQLKTSTQLTGMQVRLLDKIIGELDLNNISPGMAFVLIKSMNPNADANVDFASQQLILEQQIERMKAETLKIRHEGTQQEAQSIIDMATAEHTKGQLKTIK